jgi:hypothetical protein
MSESWQTFRIEELDTIVFACPQCKTEITFKAGADILSRQERPCPGCNREMPDVGLLLSMYRQFYERARGKVVLRAKHENLLAEP